MVVFGCYWWCGGGGGALLLLLVFGCCCWYSASGGGGVQPLSSVAALLREVFICWRHCLIYGCWYCSSDIIVLLCLFVVIVLLLLLFASNMSQRSAIATPITLDGHNYWEWAFSVKTVFEEVCTGLMFHLLTSQKMVLILLRSRSGRIWWKGYERHCH